MMRLLDRCKSSVNGVSGLRVSALLFIGCGIEDTVLTLENVSKYGVQIEGNPFLRFIMEQIGAAQGLIITKSIIVIITLYTAIMMNQLNYRIRGEYLLYAAAVCWLYGAVSNSLLL
jgi:hypothetical protein